MKTDLTTAGSFAQTKALTKAHAKNELNAKPLLGVPKGKTSPDYQVELTSKAPTDVSSPSLPSLPISPSIPKPSLSLDKPGSELTDVAKEEVKNKVKDIEVKEVKNGSVKKPAIFFIKGLDIFSSPSKSEGGYAGVGRIAEAVEGSRIYGWDQKDEIIKEIKKIHKDYPVLLIGHSLGGDTAVEIADELDSLKEGFRSIDLLVTMDAVGFSHDIIPQNVKNHLNIFGENNFFLSDGPHVARREEKTTVRNILSPHDHTDIDDDREIQYEIVSLIQKTLSDSKA